MHTYLTLLTNSIVISNAIFTLSFFFIADHYKLNTTLFHCTMYEI